MVVPASAGDPFIRRVRSLHDSWEERRQVRIFSSANDFTQQFRLLTTLYCWAEEAARDIDEVYGATLSVNLSARPSADDPASAVFSFAIQERFSATFALVARRGIPASWRLDVQIAATGSARSPIPAGPERRNGGWTRARFEEIVLSLLGAYERAAGDDIGPAMAGC